VPSTLFDRVAANTTPSRSSRQLSARGVLTGGRRSNKEDNTASAVIRVVSMFKMTVN